MKTAIALSLLLGLILPSTSLAQKESVTYTLDTSDQGTAFAFVYERGLGLLVRDARPNTLYTVWIDHKSRATGELAADYPLEQGALSRGVAPAFSLAAPVYNGILRDVNSFVTDKRGNAFWHVRLDYNLLGEGESPVVSADLNKQGENVIGGHWLRTFEEDPDEVASLQITNDRGVPVVPRSTPFGLTVQYHATPVTHGHSPGVGGVDHFGAFKGDWPTLAPAPAAR